MEMSEREVENQVEMRQASGGGGGGELCSVFSYINYNPMARLDPHDLLLPKGRTSWHCLMGED